MKKFAVNRQRPVQPPVESVVIEFTPAQLLYVIRRMQEAPIAAAPVRIELSPGAHDPQTHELNHSLDGEIFNMYHSNPRRTPYYLLLEAAREAGLVR